jgi:hypothetical protein
MKDTFCKKNIFMNNMYKIVVNFFYVFTFF